ncbi:hypothetical protein GCM10027034_05660 [Ramlibacter solisilvae]|uniref:OmpA-like domain-containing protein n=1 Tax=Ramlibacter tataouinensis TaxID=94132 RepID=A0A127JYD9_9BURK|nr:OmpA family protein [Ramlibacter tataouinensis]AMO25008.1 hypothetical protein UC35_21985 [Ramlibacter tataouinensis]
MAVNLVELISSAITPDTVQGLSKVLGERDSAVQAGIGALVPALLGGMASKASTPSGAANLLSLINGPEVDAGLPGIIGNMLSSGDSSALLQQGSSLLGGLFGSDKTSNIASALAGMTGMKMGSATNLLAMLVPLILGVLKRFFGEKRMGAGDVAGLFAGQKNFLDGKLDPRLTSAMGLGSPSSLLSGLGDTAAGVARGAAATTARASAATAATASAAVASTSGSRRWMPWALAAVVAAVLLSMLPRFGGDKASAPAVATAPSTSTGSAGLATPAPAVDPPTAAAPSTTAMGAAPASLPAKIYFETGKSELGPDSTTLIQSVASALKANPSAKVDLTGFTDKTGDTAANEALAKKRAGAVKSALESAGVAPDRVGMKEPMFVEIGAAGSDAEARRVDIAAAK